MGRWRKGGVVQKIREEVDAVMIRGRMEGK